jgi:hypothetical protein
MFRFQKFSRARIIAKKSNELAAARFRSNDEEPYLLGVVQEEVRVVRVGVAEDDGGGGHGRGGLAGDVGARVVPVDLVRLPRRRHVLRPLPAVVVRVAVAHLRAQNRQHPAGVEQL